MWVTFYYHWHKLIKADFLYVSFNLKIDKFVPYRKLNNTFLYIHSKSNQPSSITKQLSSMTNRGILSLACNEDEFNKAKPFSESPLKNSEFNYEIEPPFENAKRNRNRKFVWFNTLYSLNVKTYIAKISSIWTPLWSVTAQCTL